MRILYLLHTYPVPSQTYILNEAELVARDHDVLVLTRIGSEQRPRTHLPFEVVGDDLLDAVPAARAFGPDAVHTHWVRHVDELAAVAGALDVPYTVRSHSFDVLRFDSYRDVPWRDWRRKRARWLRRRRLVGLMNAPACAGVLGFPFGVDILRRAGVRADQLVATPPVVRTDRFPRVDEHGEGVLVLGPEDRNSNIDWVVPFARRMPGTEVRMLGMGGGEHLVGQTFGLDNLEVLPLVDPEDMAEQYRWARWLVIGATKMDRTVGWKVAAGEAWASGTGVCMPGLRPDLHDYVGDAGVLYDHPDELVDVVQGPVPPAQLAAGFAKAPALDIAGHLHLLTDRWTAAIS